MSKGKIEVSMSVYDIPIVIEALEKAEDEIKKLNDIIKEIRKIIKWSYEEHEFQGAIHSIEELINKDN